MFIPLTNTNLEIYFKRPINTLSFAIDKKTNRIIFVHILNLERPLQDRTGSCCYLYQETKHLRNLFPIKDESTYIKYTSKIPINKLREWYINSTFKY